MKRQVALTVIPSNELQSAHLLAVQIAVKEEKELKLLIAAHCTNGCFAHMGTHLWLNRQRDLELGNRVAKALFIWCDAQA